MGNFHTAGRDEAVVVSGGCCGSNIRKLVVGGRAWAWWLVSDIQRLSLEEMTMYPMWEGVATTQGIPVNVNGIAQCKVIVEPHELAAASEHFLGEDVSFIEAVILQTLERHLRAILGKLTVEEVYRDRNRFASLVREVATPDVRQMGIEILSFTIKDVFDDVDYLSSLENARRAVKRDTDIRVAEVNRDADIRLAVVDYWGRNATERRSGTFF